MATHDEELRQTILAYGADMQRQMLDMFGGGETVAREEQQPMSAARIEAIERHIARWLTPDVSALDLRNDLIEAMVENERLRAREAALRITLLFVASDHEHKWRPDRCKICGIEFSSWSADVQQQARALLASAVDEAK